MEYLIQINQEPTRFQIFVLIISSQMHWFVILQIVLSFIYVGYLIFKYSLPQISVYLTWLISFEIVVLLPFDVYYSMDDHNALSLVWKIMYWLIFLLTWFLLPIAQQYESAGQFTPALKLRRAIINNLIIYGIFAALGVVFLGYLWFTDNFDLDKLSSVLMAASNAFGMFLVVIFLSYGLVAIPRKLWRDQKYEMKLKNNQFAASSIKKQKQTLYYELQLRMKEAFWYRKDKGSTPEVQQIIELVSVHLQNKWNKNVPNLGEVNIVKIHKEVKEFTRELTRLQSRWEQLLMSTFRIEDITNHMESPNRRIQSTLFHKFSFEPLNLLVWFWHCRLKLILNPLLAIIFSLFTFSIIIAELSSFIGALSFLNPFARLILIDSFLAMDCTLLILLAYIAFCVYYALFKLKFANYYGLYWNQQTDSASLIFFAINCSRVSTPLCYNFLQIIKSEETSFSVVMGSSNLVPVFGQSFNVVFPILLIILILFNALDVYARVSRILGLQKFQFEGELSNENVEEGRRILRKARSELQTKILSSNGKNLSDFRSYKFESSTANDQPISNQNSSSEAAFHLKGAYFNQFANMDNVLKIMNM